MSRQAGVLSAVVLTLAGCGAAEPLPGEVIKATMHTSVLDQHSAGLSGVEICVDGQPAIACATTDAFGDAALAVPANSDIVLSFTKDGFVPTLREYRVGAEATLADVGPWFMQPSGWYNQAAARIGGRVDLQKRGIVIAQTAADDIDFTIAPRRDGIVGPVFFKRLGDRNLDFCMDGECMPMAAWVNVPPGGYGLRAAGYGAACHAAAFACPDGSAGCASIKARAGHVAWAQIVCTR